MLLCISLCMRRQNIFSRQGLLKFLIYFEAGLNGSTNSPVLWLHGWFSATPGTTGSVCSSGGSKVVWGSYTSGQIFFGLAVELNLHMSSWWPLAARLIFSLHPLPQSVFALHCNCAGAAEAAVSVGWSTWKLMHPKAIIFHFISLLSWPGYSCTTAGCSPGRWVGSAVGQQNSSPQLL